MSKNDGIFRPYLEDFKSKTKTKTEAAPTSANKTSTPVILAQETQNNLLPASLQNLTFQNIQNLTEYYQSVYINQVLNSMNGQNNLGQNNMQPNNFQINPLATCCEGKAVKSGINKADRFSPYGSKKSSAKNKEKPSEIPRHEPTPSKLPVLPCTHKPTSGSPCSHNPVMQLSEVITREARKKMKTIDPENMYIECPVCSKKIKRLYHFQRHMRIHSGEKQHCCPYCPYKSVRKDNLNSHLKTHEKHRQQAVLSGGGYKFSEILGNAVELLSRVQLPAQPAGNNLSTLPTLASLPTLPCAPADKSITKIINNKFEDEIIVVDDEVKDVSLQSTSLQSFLTNGSENDSGSL